MVKNSKWPIVKMTEKRYNVTVVRKDILIMIELRVVIDKIDYDSLAGLLAPVIEEQIKMGGIPVWAKLLFLGRGINEDSVKSFLQKLPEGAKDSLASSVINSNGDKVCEMLEKFARENGVRLKVKKATAEKL